MKGRLGIEPDGKVHQEVFYRVEHEAWLSSRDFIKHSMSVLWPRIADRLSSGSIGDAVADQIRALSRG